MAVTESDLRTFSSCLKKECQPNVDIIVNDYRWAVHSHVITDSSESFLELYSNAPPGSKRQEVHLDGDEPAIIAHLILWWYTDEYDDEPASDNSGLDIQSLMKHGKASASGHSDEAISDPDAEPDDAQEDTGYMGSSPISLHAKMYLIAHKYKITVLREKATNEIAEILGMVKEALLPCLSHFFVTDSPSDRSMSANVGAGNTGSSTGTGGGLPSPTNKHTISEKEDAELWKVLAKTASRHFRSYHTDPVFQHIATSNPRFHWDVMGRVASMLEAAQDKLASTPAEPPKTPKKRGRKKQEVTAPGTAGEPAEDNDSSTKKGKRGGAGSSKKLKTDP
ncbi:hypothetical protein AYO21_10753 [Fonsecaea monophora]|uniref:BTB domain-containing protein n=1 Tax=Fonsecaea monophora TaxID=254056 RepID=A0A177EUW3_9EURO|nr:hypothetical protein AYO21_10753 [Fonsecaea monophora]OAG35080.1 hypothetical protein AYO21_10753 [Fonsecaea monophora]